jgi:hypothetical protein
VNPGFAEHYERDYTHEEVVRMQALSTLGTLEDVIAHLKALVTAYGEMRYSPLATIPLEVMLMERLKK